MKTTFWVWDLGDFPLKKWFIVCWDPVWTCFLLPSLRHGNCGNYVQGKRGPKRCTKNTRNSDIKVFSFKKSEEKHFQKHLWLSGTYMVSRRRFSSPQKATFRVNFVQNYFHQAQVNSCCWNLLTLVYPCHPNSLLFSIFVYPCLPLSTIISQLVSTSSVKKLFIRPKSNHCL